MIKKIIYDAILVPKPESSLDMDAVGLQVSMANETEADYKDIHSLSEILNVSEKEIETAAEKLIKKEYLKGMCADWAIHDSENDKGQRNLHIHVLLTMRSITENGEWGAKTKKVYVLDENGERIPLIDKKTGQQKVDKRNRKQWKCQTVESTDWNSQENAKAWRKDLADTINAANEQLGISVYQEHRSFKEQGIDREPTVHIKREIIKRNMMLEQAKAMIELAKQTVLLMLCNIKLIGEERSYPSKLHNALSPIHDRNLILAHKLYAILSSDDFTLCFNYEFFKIFPKISL